MKNSYAQIIENYEIDTNIYKLILDIDTNPDPGQFYMVKGLHGDYLLPRPISVHDYKDGKLTLLYRISGHGTEMISKMRNGNELQLLGPLGNGFKSEILKGKVAIIGGGIGIAPLLYLTKNIINKADIFLGFKDTVYCIDDFKTINENIVVATENGRFGNKGYITDFVNFDNYDTVITCGPDIMMEKIVKICNEKNIKVFASLEKRMACGVGSCLGCVTKTTNGNKRVCKDGPVFDGKELVF